jgi:hypothetical protein
LIVPASFFFILAKLARDQAAVLSLPTPTEPPHFTCVAFLLLDRSALQLLFPGTGVLNSETALRCEQVRAGRDKLVGQPQRHADGYVNTAYAHGTVDA